MGISLVIYTLLTIIIVITIFIVIMWSLAVQTVPTYAAAPQYTASGFGMTCSITPPANGGQNRPDQFTPQECGTGLVCYNGFCLKDVGTDCVNLWECVPGTIVCNGHCSMTGKAGLNFTCSSDSDCDTGLVCDNLICKEDTGSACTTTDDCTINNFCNNASICQLQAQPTQLCTIVTGENTCVDGYVCSSANPNPSVPGVYPAFCQPNGTVTGGVGSFCYFWSQPTAPPVTDGGYYKFLGPSDDLVQVPACSSSSVCAVPRDSNGVPINPPATGYGMCGLVGNWNGACDSVTACQLPQVCINGLCDFPLDQQGQLPLACDANTSTGICLTGYQCSSDVTTCLGTAGNTNIPANDGTGCVSGNVSSSNQIVYQLFQTNVAVDPNRLTDASWLNLNTILPAVLTGIPYYNLTFTSFHSSTGISALFHIFGDNNNYICTDTSYTLNTLSSNVIGVFPTTIAYTGTDNNNNPIPATVNITYTSIVDYVGYSTRGNYYAVVRYTLSLPVNYPSPPYPNVSQPLLTDFSRIYYDTDPTFVNNNITFDPITGLPTYTQYFEYVTDTTPFNVQYIYSVSVDDRLINANEPNSVRFYMVVQNTTNSSAMPPTTATNDIITGFPQQSGALVGLNASNYTDSTSFYPLTFIGVSYSIFEANYGDIEYNIVWCQAYVYRTMIIASPESQCFARENGSDFNPNIIRMYQSIFGQFFVGLFPYSILEAENINLRQLGIYTSRSFDITQGSYIYIITDRNGDHLITSYLSEDNSVAANVGINTSVSVPFVSADIDVLGYVPRVLLYTPVCM